MSELEHNPKAYNALFARFEEKLDNIATSLVEIKGNNKILEDEIRAELKELSRRVSSLESFKAKALGAIAVISAIATYFWHKAFK